MSNPPKRWFNSKSLAGYRSQVVAAINGCRDGAYVTIDLKTANALADICEQAAWTEINHEQPELDIVPHVSRRQ